MDSDAEKHLRAAEIRIKALEIAMELAKESNQTELTALANIVSGWIFTGEWPKGFTHLRSRR
ncbi:MAG TPA: hypothetical protein VFG05_09180 [Methylocella sp.]|nr:hypothetical protein [Methylocella sp.]